MLLPYVNQECNAERVLSYRVSQQANNLASRLNKLQLSSYLLLFQTQAKTKDPYLSVNHCAADMIHIKGNLFCGYIGEEHKPTSWVLDVTGMKKIMMGFVSDDENDFKGFLLRWILEQKCC